MTNSTNKTTNTDNANSGNDYVNHYLTGTTIIYVYSFGEHYDEVSGKTLRFFNGNIKVGKKDGNNYQPVQGTLSPLAYDKLKAIIPLVDSGTHTVGLSVKTPRFEGTTAFLANAKPGDKNVITLADGSNKVMVSAARLRLNNIESYMLFDKDQKVTEEAAPAQQAQAPAQQAQAPAQPAQAPARSFPEHQAPAPTSVNGH